MIKKPELIEEWKKAHKLWSVRLSAIGAAVMGVFTFWPDSALYLWSAMPSEVREMIPERFVSAIALFVFAASAISRIVKQRPINGRYETKPADDAE